MSHLIEEYAKNLGVKISKPIVSRHFWPLVFDEYITISLEDQAASKNYKYYEIVIDMIKNFLNAKGIKVIQVGSPKSPMLNNVDARMLGLSFKNTAYIISKAKLHIGVDNVFSHYASSINVPLVTLFGNVYSNISRGYWSKNQTNIEAPWKVKPSLNSLDANDSINKINPEKIASEILKSLNINGAIPLKTKFIGNYYTNRVVEIVPDFFQPIEDLKNQTVFLRLDYGYDGNFIGYWCNFLNSYAIFSEKLLPLDFCQSFAQKIKGISFIVSKDSAISEEYLRDLSSLGIPITLLVENEDDLPEMRNKFFDYPVQLYFKTSKKDLPEDCSDFSKLYFNSSKTILANNQKYPSKYHWQQQKNFIDKNFNLEDNETLLEELNHFYVYERTK
jgi:hypothetical protein